MGYYSWFEVTVKRPKKVKTIFEVVKNKLNEFSEYDFDSYSNDDDKDTTTFVPYDTIKWYDHDEDMTRLSMEFPDMLFMLDGKGEDDERWRTYYKNGKSQSVPVTIVYGKPDMKYLNSKDR